MKQIHRHEIPVDDRWHELELAGPILYVDARWAHIVELWAVHDDTAPTYTDSYRVYGTDQPLDDGIRHVGSVTAAGGALVWHLFRQRSEPEFRA